jgi:broad specificity phosphatase PhoE
VTIFLVRHGETACNAARVVQPADASLSPRGVAQAEQLGRRLAREGARRIRSSDLLRARQTAAVVAQACGAPVELDPALQERSFGALRGTAYADLAEDIFAPDYEPPDGESWAAFHVRVRGAWNAALRVAATGDGPLVVVTHGLVCYAILAGGLVEAPGWVPTMRFANASLTRIEGPAPGRARLIDCTAHLRTVTGDSGVA